MKKIVIIFSSGYGHTRKLAKHIATGASLASQCEVEVFELQDNETIPWDKLAAADAIIFGSPTYMGTVSARFKDFMDQSGQIWLKQPWKNKLAAGFTISTSPSGDKSGTLNSLMVFAMQHGMLWIGQSELGDPKNDNEHSINRAGGWVGLMATSNPDKEKVLFAGDIKTAELFGQRIARACLRFN